MFYRQQRSLKLLAFAVFLLVLTAWIHPIPLLRANVYYTPYASKLGYLGAGGKFLGSSGGIGVLGIATMIELTYQVVKAKYYICLS